MVVGNGMIAKAMQNIDHNSLIFFCSGVSNSNEKNEFNYEREKKLLDSFSESDQCLIYFSSYFVNFDHYLDERYYRHKLEMESMIRNKFSCFKIFRLPQIVGYSNNPYTLTNFFYNSMMNQSTIKLYKNAVRNLIDLDDIVKIVKYVNENKYFINQSTNLIGTKNYEVRDIVQCFEKILGHKAVISTQEHHEIKFDIKISEEMLQIYRLLNLHFDHIYLKNLLEKYYKKGIFND